MRLVRLILILAKEFIIGRHLWKWSMSDSSPVVSYILIDYFNKGCGSGWWWEGEKAWDDWQILFSRWRMHQWRILSKLKISKIDLSILVILIRNCLALTYPVEEKMVVFFEEKGLAQHFRAKHAGVFFDEEEFTREAWRLFKSYATNQASFVNSFVESQANFWLFLSFVQFQHRLLYFDWSLLRMQGKFDVSIKCRGLEYVFSL